ncbi:MAG: hypothetical protein V4490_08570 [Pseudomonadota bacterium]
MADIIMSYMAVTLAVADHELQLQCWMTTVDEWAHGGTQFPYQYTHLGERCTWLIHSNYQLTMKMLALVGEQADRICCEQVNINDKRKLSNR